RIAKHGIAFAAACASRGFASFACQMVTSPFSWTVTRAPILAAGPASSASIWPLVFPVMSMCPPPPVAGFFAFDPGKIRVLESLSRIILDKTWGEPHGLEAGASPATRRGKRYYGDQGRYGDACLRNAHRNQVWPPRYADRDRATRHANEGV